VELADESIEGVSIRTRSGLVYDASLAFDSRIDPAFFNEQPGFSKVWQHFLGWEVEADCDLFNPDSFTLMDFRLRFKDTCSFMYILPKDERRALVEFTFFSPDLLDRSVYEQMIKEYLAKFFPEAIFRKTDEEFGVIPMSDYPFHSHGSERIIKIGTAGSWAKPATGYSFRNTERCIDQLMSNLKAGIHPAKGLISKKHRIYDTLFLDLLHHHNETGPDLFARMYRMNPITRIFRFLDDQSTFAEDLRIMWTFDSGPFMRVIGKKIFQTLKGLRS
jgi:lycopene beta-cyclase